MIPEVVFMAVQCLWPEVMLDQFKFLGNCLPTPPLTHVSALKSHVSQKHWLGVGWMGSFENNFLVFLFFIQNFKFSVAFLLEIQWTFQSGTHSAGKQQDYLLREGDFECQETIAHVKHMLLSDFYMGKNDTFWAYLKHRMLGYLILRYLSASRV